MISEVSPTDAITGGVYYLRFLLLVSVSLDGMVQSGHVHEVVNRDAGCRSVQVVSARLSSVCAFTCHCNARSSTRVRSVACRTPAGIACRSSVVGCSVREFSSKVGQEFHLEALVSILDCTRRYSARQVIMFGLTVETFAQAKRELQPETLLQQNGTMTEREKVVAVLPHPAATDATLGEL